MVLSNIEYSWNSKRNIESESASQSKKMEKDEYDLCFSVLKGWPDFNLWNGNNMIWFKLAFLAFDVEN